MIMDYLYQINHIICSGIIQFKEIFDSYYKISFYFIKNTSQNSYFEDIKTKTKVLKLFKYKQITIFRFCIHAILDFSTWPV